MTNSIEKTSFHLPTDLIYHTLVRLPVKTLIRFKSVCKAWCVLIENPNFVAQQRKIQLSLEFDPTLSFMLITTDYSKFRLLNFNDVSHKLTESWSSYYLFESCMVVGICDGLVCLCSNFGAQQIIICNPTIRQLRIIPPAKFPRNRTNVIFLGFCSHVNDYELLRIVYNYCYMSWVHAELYTMGTDTWREIEVELGFTSYWIRKLYKPYLNYTNAVIINRVFYWEVPSCGLYVPFFDINTGVFDVIEAPPEISTDKSWSWKLHCIKDELVLIIDKKNITFEMWLLIKGMPSYTWTKIHKIDFGANISYYPIQRGKIRVLGSTRNGELVLERRVDAKLKLFLYNSNSKDIKCLHDVNVMGIYTYDACLYTPALTPIN